MINLLPILLLFPQETETLRVDDGTPYNWGGNDFSEWREAVSLPVPDSAWVLGLLFYPANPNGLNPKLHYCLWDDDDGGNPGTLLAEGVINPSYDSWNYINISGQNITVNKGWIYPGWSSEDQRGDTVYFNWHDTFLDGYNWWYDGVLWHQDDGFPGDFLIRAVAEVYYAVEEGEPIPEATLSVYPNPGSGPLNIRLRVPEDSRTSLVLTDMLGRNVFRLEEYLRAGTHIITITSSLPRGAYILRAEMGNKAFTERIIVE
ncbi:MAG: T9SS type A sorting domain-containing protein [candidate division WOR-3 bacterium]